MPLLTLSEAKTLLQIAPSDTSQDVLISELLIRVEEEVVQYCNNRFINPRTQLVSVTIAFLAATTTPAANAKITDSEGAFLDAGFDDGMDVRVSGSALNDGAYVIKTAEAGTLTLQTANQLFNEAAGSVIVLSRVIWPKAIQLPVSKLLKYHMEKAGKLVSQETLPGGYTAYFKSEEEILKELNRWRKPY
jgi:alpha-galactosidase